MSKNVRKKNVEKLKLFFEKLNGTNVKSGNKQDQDIKPKPQPNK